MHHLKPSQARFITLCQQLLALAVVAALIAPASGVLTLDVVREDPHGHPAAAGASLVSATVPGSAVAPEVTEIPLGADTGSTTPPAGREKSGGQKSGGDLVTNGRGSAGTDAPETPQAPADARTNHVTSAPEPVTGYGAVGITWGSGQHLSEDQITLKVRTRTGERWSGWTEMEYHDEHAPDPNGADAASARPGTEPVFVGEVDDVQVQVDTARADLPEGLSLAVVAPGRATQEESETPALQGQAPAAGQDGTAVDQSGTEAAGDDAAVLQAAQRRTAAQPTIFSRAQWGADESIRNKKALSYGTISAGFVHHTVNANDYTEEQVPGIIRSIYAYHVKSRGWSDIGYNFLVDRFGRIWEGRYGGIDKPVIGAHTLNYNQYSFAMSAIGNYETAQPSDALLQAYGQLFAWKLSLHGVDPASTSQRVGSGTFQAINGHRDAGSTACPGKYLYAKLPVIRQYASSAGPLPPTPVAVSAPNLQSNLAGSAYPDLVVRRASDGRGLVVPTEGLTAFSTKTVAHGRGWSKRRNVVATPDVTGDGIVDLLATDSKGYLQIRPGNPAGTYGKATRVVKSTARHSLIAAVGDLNGDKRNDLVAKYGSRLVVFLGAKGGGFKRVVGPKGFGGYVQLVGPGDFDGNGTQDLLARSGKGTLAFYPGDGKGGFGSKRAVPGAWGSYLQLAGGGDFTGDGRADLIAKARNGDVFVLPQTAPGRFGAAIGPTANLRSITSITSAGNIVGDLSGDLVGVRGDKLVVVANRGTRELGTPIDTGISLAGATMVLNTGDLNRDGAGDFVVRDAAGSLRSYFGDGTGAFRDSGAVSGGFATVADLKAVGDVTGDGVADLVGTYEGTFSVWTGNGAGGFNPAAPIAGRMTVPGGLPSNTSKYDFVFGIQDVRLRAPHDYMARARNTGLLYLFDGTSGAPAVRRPIGYLTEYDLVG